MSRRFPWSLLLAPLLACTSGCGNESSVDTTPPTGPVAAGGATSGAGQPASATDDPPEGHFDALDPILRRVHSYEIRDPQHAVGAVEWVDAGGEPLESFGSMSVGTNPSKVSESLTIETAADVLVKFHLVTEQSVVAVPFEFKGLALPQSE